MQWDETSVASSVQKRWGRASLGGQLCEHAVKGVDGAESKHASGYLTGAVYYLVCQLLTGQSGRKPPPNYGVKERHIDLSPS